MSGYPLILEQFDGAAPLRSVRLDGTALPEGAMHEHLRLRVQETHYPGSDDVNVQVLGRERKAIRIRGLLSDRESRVTGYADAGRAALKALWNDGRRVRLLYRTLSLIGHIQELEFFEAGSWEVRYDLEFLPQSESVYPAQVVVSRDLFDVLQAAAEAIAEADVAYEELPEEVREAPPEWVPDPWLEFRLKMEEVKTRLRMLAELTGNEAALNVSDRAESAMRAGWTATNQARTALDEWDGSALGVADQLTQGENVMTMMTSLDSVGLALR